MIGEKGKVIHGKNWRKKSRDIVSLNNIIAITPSVYKVQ